MKLPESEQQWVRFLFGRGLSVQDVARHLKITQKVVRGHIEAMGGESAFKSRGQDAAETIDKVVAAITDGWKIAAGRRRRAVALVTSISEVRPLRPAWVCPPTLPVPDGQNPALGVPLAETDISVNTSSVLQRAGIEYIWQLVEHTEDALLKRVEGFGRRNLVDVIARLADMDGLTLDMRVKHMFDPQYTPLT